MTDAPASVLAFDAYLAADKAWRAATPVYPVASATVNARSMPEGKGAPGSPLRAAYERRDAARLVYQAAIGGKGGSP